ncbi:hypothetical protein K466DRAFT_570384 [Polyporus arcularius HHB13444]|uniref:Uncharacterized protein n=1 Tax=Polyporus arcularius HHB13444 TaxID=1314778 RepID=A0A5C3NT70_9APHY|nr:hypothetical protein K466DRAFT_570384 [Polyporus arcularius HHB13444]
MGEVGGVDDEDIVIWVGVGHYRELLQTWERTQEHRKTVNLLGSPVYAVDGALSIGNDNRVGKAVRLVGDHHAEVLIVIMPVHLDPQASPQLNPVREAGHSSMGNPSAKERDVIRGFDRQIRRMLHDGPSRSSKAIAVSKGKQSSNCSKYLKAAPTRVPVYVKYLFENILEGRAAGEGDGIEKTIWGMRYYGACENMKQAV